MKEFINYTNCLIKEVLVVAYKDGNSLVAFYKGAQKQ